MVWLWLRGELYVEELERLGLDGVAAGEAGEGVLALAYPQLVSADGAEFGDQVGKSVAGRPSAVRWLPSVALAVWDRSAGATGSAGISEVSSV